MSSIPAFLLKKLYVKGSLKATADNCSLTIKNTIAPGTIVRVTSLKIDALPVALDAVTISSAGSSRPASSISPARPLAFNLNAEAVITMTGVMLAPGRHTLAVSLRTAEVGELSIQVEDALVADGDKVAPMLFLEAFIIVILIAINGFFAAAEMAVVSARKVRLELLADAGDRQAKAALRLIEHPNTFLATVQIGITLVGTAASAFGGARVAVVLHSYLDTVPWLQAYSGPLSLGIVVIAITYLSLVLGELAPKRLALLAPEQYARRVAIPFLAFSAVGAPIVRFLNGSSRLIVRFLAGDAHADSAITSEEIEAILETGVEEGALEQTEQEMLQSVLDLSDLQVRMMMRPRTDITGVEAGRPVRDVLPILANTGLSRIPVYQSDLDHIVGILSLRDFIALDPSTLDDDVAHFAREALFVSENMPALRLLETFKREKSQMAIVLDEYGGTAGLVTLQDVLEQIVGDLSDEYDRVSEPQIRQQESSEWMMSGRTPIEDLKQALGLRTLDGEDVYRFETLAGFLLAHLGRIPKAGDALARQGFRFEIVHMDGLQVDQVKVAHGKDGDNRG